MKRNLLLVCIAVLMLLLFSGCSEPATPVATTLSSTTAAPTLPPPSPEELYASARDAVEQAPNRLLTFQTSLTQILNDVSYTEASSGTASYIHFGQEDMTAVIEQQLELGKNTYSYIDAYSQNTAYAVVSNCYFQNELTPEEFIRRQLPGILLDASLYSSIRLTQQTDTTTLLFSGATMPEQWLSEENITLISASGAAVLDASGALILTEYICDFTRGDARYTLAASVRISTPKELDLSAKQPVPDEECVVLQDLSAPRKLLQTVSRIYSAPRVQCNGLETVYSEAIPYAYSLTSEISLSGFGEELISRAYYRSAVSDYRGQIISQEQTESYADGIFTSVVDNKTPTENPYMSPDIIRQQLEDKILSGLLALKYLDGAVAGSQGGMLQLELTGNELFQKDMLQHLTSTLQLDLKVERDAIQIQAIGCTLLTDPNTGLPSSMELLFELTHEKEGVPYRLAYRQEYTLSFPTEAE